MIQHVDQILKAHKQLLSRADALQEALVALPLVIEAASETPETTEAHAPEENEDDRIVKVQSLGQELAVAALTHFDFETRGLLPAIALGLGSPRVTAWTYCIERQHGAMLALLRFLQGEFDDLTLPIPVERKVRLLLHMETLRKDLVAHALEEDTKFESLIRDNSSVQKHIREALVTRKGDRAK